MKCAISALREATAYRSIRQAFEKEGLWPVNRDKCLEQPVVLETQELAKAVAQRTRTGIWMNKGKGFYGGQEGVKEALMQKKAVKMKAPAKKRKKKQDASEEESVDESEDESVDESEDESKDKSEDESKDESEDKSKEESEKGKEKSKKKSRKRSEEDSETEVDEEVEEESAESKMKTWEEELDRRAEAISKQVGQQLIRVDVPGDGSCQFHSVLACISALPHQIRSVLPSAIASAYQLRIATVDWMEANADTPLGAGGSTLRHFHDEGLGEWEPYLAKLRIPGTWGDELTLLAMACLLGITIHNIPIPSEQRDDFFDTTIPWSAPLAEIWIANLNDYHYEALLSWTLKDEPHDVPLHKKRVSRPPKHF